MNEEYVEGIKQYHDMKTWMILAGALQIFVGLFFVSCGLMTILGFFMQSISQESTISMEMALGGLIFYIFLSTAVIYLGIGTIKCKKWARALGTAGWGLMLVYGVIGMVYFFLIISEYPKMLPQKAGGPPIQNILPVIMLIMGIIISIFTIGVPALFFFFFKNRHVKMTCESYDTKRRWTDAVPVPVLPLVLVMVSFLMYILMMPFYNFIIPFFGEYIMGFKGALVLIPCLILVIFLIKPIYKLKIYSWYITLVSGIIFGISILLTFFKADYIDLYKKMGYPEKQIELMQKMDITPGIITSGILTFICFLIYMLWIKKYFKNDPI